MAAALEFNPTQHRECISPACGGEMRWHMHYTLTVNDEAPRTLMVCTTCGNKTPAEPTAPAPTE